MIENEAPRMRERVSLLHVVVIVMLAVVLVVIGQSSVRLSSLERRVGTQEARTERLENWMMENGQISAQRHIELMKILTTLSANSEYVVEYYRRASNEAEAGHK